MKTELAPFSGGWEAHRNRHCVWIVSPKGYEHSRAFEEVAQGLSFAFAELGGFAPIVRDPSEWAGRVPIVLGANLFRFTGTPELPPGSIIYNLEQALGEGDWFTGPYRSLLRRHPVLDYSPTNLAALRRRGLPHARLLELGYSPVWTRIQHAETKNIDVAFFGALSDRRTAILYEIDAHGLVVIGKGGIYGEERDHILARSKIALNIHYYDNSVFEIVRVSYLLANRLCVVSEGTEGDPDLAWLAGGLVIAPAPSLGAVCAKLAADPAQREAIAQRGFDLISRRRQSDFLRQLVLS